MDDAKLDRAARTVYENLVRAMLVTIKNQRKIWRLMDEAEQDQLLAQLDDQLHAAVRNAVDLVAASDMPHIKVTLDKVVFSDEVQGTIKMPNTDALRHRLADAAKRTVILVVPDYEAHLQGERPRPEPDQAALDLGSVIENATAQADAETAEQTELATKANRKACYVELLSLGFDHTEEEIAEWSPEQIVEARAWILAAKGIADDSAMPDMPQFMERWPSAAE